MNLENILDVGGFDIETYGWWTAKPEVYMIAVATGKGDFVIDCFDNVELDEVASGMYENRKARRLCYPTENELRYRASELIRELDINVWGGQNIKAFDLPQLLKDSDKLFVPGADNSEPFYTGSSSPMKTYGLKSNIVIDTWDFARNFLGMFLPDNKIETIASFASKFYKFVYKYVKAESYEEQKQLYLKARKGDKDAGFRLAQYCYDDTIMHRELAKLFLPFILRFAELTRSTANDAGSCSKKKIASRLWDYFHLKRSKQLRSGGLRHVYDNFDVNGAYPKGFSWYRDKVVQETIKSQPRKGVFRNACVVYLPLSNGLDDFFRCNKLTKHLSGLIEDERNPISKIIYMQMRDALSIEPLRDALEIKDAREKEYLFGKKYSHFIGRDFGYDEFWKAFKLGLDKLAAGLKNEKVINISNNLVFLEDVPKARTFKMQVCGFVNVGFCDLISVAPGQVIYKMNDEILCSGIAVPSRKKRLALDYESGQMTNIEIRALRDVIEAIFNGESADEIVKREIGNITSGKTELTDYISAVKVVEEQKNVSYRAKGRMSYEAIRKLDAKPGETLLFVMADDKIKCLGYEPGNNCFYYIDRKSAGGVRSSERKYLKQQGFGNGIRIDKEKYIDMIFGSGSKLSKILSACKY